MTLLYLALAYLVGIGAGYLAWQAGRLGCGTPTWLWIAPLLLFPVTPLLDRPRPQQAAVSLRWPQSAGFRPPRAGPSPALIAACALALLAGALRYASSPLAPCLAPGDLAYYNARSGDQDAPPVTLTGHVANYPTPSGARLGFVLAAATLDVGNGPQPVTGRAMLTVPPDPRLVYGQPVTVRGRLTDPPDSPAFSYRDVLARRSIHSAVYGAEVTPLPGPALGNSLLRILYAVRAQGEALIDRTLPEPYAALANGMLLGIDAGIPNDLYDQFSATGASHVIVISGSNVALIAGVLIAAGAALAGRRGAPFIALAGIAAYALLVGGDASVTRAAIMGGLLVIAAALGRRSTALVSLGAAAWLMALWNPLVVWDIGFQLSAAATAGLILLAPPLARWVPGARPAALASAASGAPAVPASRWGGLLAESLVFTLAATVAITPLVLYHFQRASLVTLLTNVLIVPVQPLILLSGSGALVVGLAASAWLAQPLFWLAWAGLAWTVGVVRWTAALPGASVAVAGFGLSALALTYALLLAAVQGATPRSWLRRQGAALGAWLRRDWAVRLFAPTALILLAAACTPVWSAVRDLPDGRLHVRVLDVPGGGLFIATPSGRQVLVDGGRSASVLLGELGAAMPYWDRTLDVAIVATGSERDASAQVDAAERFTVSTALYAADAPADFLAEWQTAMYDAGADVQPTAPGGWLDLGDDVALWIEDADEAGGLAARVVYGDFDMCYEAGELEGGVSAAHLETDGTLLWVLN